jgi:hypothetical protein
MAVAKPRGDGATRFYSGSSTVLGTSFLYAANKPRCVDTWKAVSRCLDSNIVRDCRRCYNSRRSINKFTLPQITCSEMRTSTGKFIDRNPEQRRSEIVRSTADS